MRDWPAGRHDGHDALAVAGYLGWRPLLAWGCARGSWATGVFCWVGNGMFYYLCTIFEIGPDYYLEILG